MGCNRWIFQDYTRAYRWHLSAQENGLVDSILCWDDYITYHLFNKYK